ncbi:MAG: carboxypeptidase-like regulatory domain-containing protein [Bacteroidota bacterium]
MLKLVKVLIYVLGLMGCTAQLLAQSVNGYVKDAVSHSAIAGAQVITNTITVLTNAEGNFKLNAIKAGEKVAIRIMGYETTEFTLTTGMLKDTLQVYLKQGIINLKEVVIKTKRNYKLDSINLRKEYAAAFKFKAPGFSDMFIMKDPNYKSPFAFINPQSTASIVSLNVLQVISLLGKKKEPASKFKQLLLKDEEANYVDQIFSKEKVGQITGLAGDSLSTFMNQYRPGRLVLKKMTGYEVVLYIKKSYIEFRKGQ